MAEFMEYHASLTSMVKSMNYDFHEVVKSIIISSPDIRKMDGYPEARKAYVSFSSGCENEDDIVHWMSHFCRLSIQYGIETKNLDWKIKFIAAWDIVSEFLNGEERKVA